MISSFELTGSRSHHDNREFFHPSSKNWFELFCKISINLAWGQGPKSNSIVLSSRWAPWFSSPAHIQSRGGEKAVLPYFLIRRSAGSHDSWELATMVLTNLLKVSVGLKGFLKMKLNDTLMRNEGKLLLANLSHSWGVSCSSMDRRLIATMQRISFGIDWPCLFLFHLKIRASGAF
jgi:hypothetical protein